MGKFNTRLRIGIALAILPVLTLGASGKKQRIDSRWKDREITIDGDNGEWPGPLVPVDEHQRLDAAAANDGQFLYLVLSTSDATLRARSSARGSSSGSIPGAATGRRSASSSPSGWGTARCPAAAAVSTVRIHHRRREAGRASHPGAP